MHMDDAGCHTLDNSSITPAQTLVCNIMQTIAHAGVIFGRAYSAHVGFDSFFVFLTFMVMTVFSIVKPTSASPVMTQV